MIRERKLSPEDVGLTHSPVQRKGREERKRIGREKVEKK